jgi:hypothetical protein
MLRQRCSRLGFVSFAADGHSDAIIVGIQQWTRDIIAKHFDLIPCYLCPARVVADDGDEWYSESQTSVVLHDAVPGTAIAPKQPYICTGPCQFRGNGKRRPDTQSAKGARVQPLQRATRPQNVGASADEVSSVADEDALSSKHAVYSVSHRHWIQARITAGFAWLARHLRLGHIFVLDALFLYAHAL